MKPPLKLMRDVFSRHNFYIQDADGGCVFEADCDYQDDMEYIIAAVNACHALGLTKEQLEADAIGKLRSRADALCEAAESLIDSEPCRYDHNDFCQEHYCGRPCKNEVARQAVAEYKGATP